MKLTRYKNLEGNSGVYAYEIDIDSIKVQFIDGSIYLYTIASAGSDHINRMKNLALNGRGLSTFISTFVRERYSAKLR